MGTGGMKRKEKKTNIVQVQVQRGNVIMTSLLCRLVRPFTMNDSPTQATSPAQTATDDVDCGCMHILHCAPLHNS
jgi:hypothetical protein